MLSVGSNSELLFPPVSFLLPSHHPPSPNAAALPFRRFLLRPVARRTADLRGSPSLPDDDDSSRRHHHARLVRPAAPRGQVVSASEDEVQHALYGSNTDDDFIPELIGDSEIFDTKLRKHLIRVIPARCQGETRNFWVVLFLFGLLHRILAVHHCWV